MIAQGAANQVAEVFRLPSTYYRPRPGGLQAAGRRLAELAVHEAGHAVLGEQLGFRCRGIVLFPNVSTPWGRARPSGQSYSSGLPEALEHGSREHRDWLHRRIRVLQAGSLAETLCLGRPWRVDDGDHQAALALLYADGVAQDRAEACWMKLLEGTRARVAMGETRRAIVRVAERLVGRGRLDGLAVSAVLRGR